MEENKPATIEAPVTPTPVVPTTTPTIQPKPQLEDAPLIPGLTPVVREEPTVMDEPPLVALSGEEKSDESINIGPAAVVVTDTSVKAAHKGGSRHIFVIGVATVVMLALSAGIIYAYQQRTSTSVKKPGNTGVQQSSNSAITPATLGDVDGTTKAIDENLTNIDSDKDFTTNDLSDATLGL